MLNMNIRVAVIALHCALVWAASSSGNSAGQYEAEQAIYTKAAPVLLANSDDSGYSELQQDYGQGGGYKQEEKYPHQPYGFGYNIDDGYGNKQWRHEKSSSPHSVSGTYGFKDKNGIMREVEYIADKNGFRAMIKTTEPGTSSKDPAYVKVSAQPMAVDWYPPKKQPSYGKGHAQAYQKSSGGESYSQSQQANNYGAAEPVYEPKPKYNAESSGYVAKIIEGNEVNYSSAVSSGAKSTMTLSQKYQDKKKKK